MMYMYLFVIQFACSYCWGKLNSTEVMGVNRESAKYPPWFKISRIEKQIVGERIRSKSTHDPSQRFFYSGSNWIVTEILRLRLL